jgi:hypothetical protein
MKRSLETYSLSSKVHAAITLLKTEAMKKWFSLLIMIKFLLKKKDRTSAKDKHLLW